MPKKKIVYLFGAGATQAVVKAIDSKNGLLTKDIQDEIRKNYRPGLDDKIWNELLSVSDIEHLISVLDTQNQTKASEKIRGYYRESIIAIAKPISDNPPKKN